MTHFSECEIERARAKLKLACLLFLDILTGKWKKKENKAEKRSKDCWVKLPSTFFVLHTDKESTQAKERKERTQSFREKKVYLVGNAIEFKAFFKQ